MNRQIAIPAAVLSITLSAACAQSIARPAVDRDAIVEGCLSRADSTWQAVKALDPALTAPEVFEAALIYSEAKIHRDRLLHLVEAGARFQDRDPRSRGYGNFRWRWREGVVLDFNAGDFAMQAAAPLWIRHKARLSPDGREVLRKTIDLAVKGLLRRRVPPSYTNVALMNAGNLVLLGEALRRPEVADEGYQRFAEAIVDTWVSGFHEYGSPSYYAINLNELLLIEEYAARDEGREQARAMLRLFWREIASNFFPPSGRLAGARSREYDYVCGRGGIEGHLVFHGWLTGRLPCNIFLAVTSWEPEYSLLQSSREGFPRFVRQSWGRPIMHAKSHYLTKDVSLSAAGANYGPIDIPLSIDLPGAIDRPRGYFIPDGRRDPYGETEIPAGPHSKALHLQPFYAAVQRRTDVLALTVYRESDVPASTPTLESHIVLPLDVDSAWIDERAIDLHRARFTERLKPGEALVLRDGEAAVGIRLPWTRSLGGETAPAALIYDGNGHRALRLTVAHHSLWGNDAANARPGAAFWVRVGGAIGNDATFDAWHSKFRAAEATAELSGPSVRIRVPGEDGPLVITASEPFHGCSEAEPPHTRDVLNVNGASIGRDLLANLTPVKEYLRRQDRLRQRTLNLSAAPMYFEAESGMLESNMQLGEDDVASAGEFVWVPGEPGSHSRATGSVTWRLSVPEPGNYYLWGNINTPTPHDDSFFVHLYNDEAEPIARVDWHTGKRPKWEWVPVTVSETKQSAVFSLPTGFVTLKLLAREDGAKIDRLLLTSDVDYKPH